MCYTYLFGHTEHVVWLSRIRAVVFFFKSAISDTELKMNQEEEFTFKLQERMYIKKKNHIHNEWEAEVHNCEMKWTFLPLYPHCFPTVSRLLTLNQTSYCVLPLKQQQRPFCCSSGCCQKLPFSERLFPPPFQFWKIAVRSNNTICTDGQKSVAFLFKGNNNSKQLGNKKWISMSTNVTTSLEFLILLDKH